jgi:hypothetical protein
MIIVATDNLRKFDELRHIFGRYNIKLRRRSRSEFDEQKLPKLFAEKRRVASPPL